MKLIALGRRVSVLLATTYLTTGAGLFDAAAVERDPAALQRASGTTFDLPAQSLPQTLNEIAKATGASIAFNERELRGITAQPVRGKLSTRQALTAALAGTGASYQFKGSRKITVVAPVGVLLQADGQGTALPTIDVQGNSGGSNSG